MATRQIGKLKFNLSRRGLAYKWGDGEIHRYPFGSSRSDSEDEYEEDRGAYESDGYDEPYEEDGPQGFLFDNDWVMWLALIVFAPLGIYILWKKRKYDTPTSAAITVGALIWFVILLMLIFGGGRKDPTDINKTDTIRTITMAPTVAPVVSMMPTQRPTVAPIVTIPPEETPAPSPTPLAVDPSLIRPTDGDETDAENTYVYYTIKGTYYHKDANCDGMKDASRGTVAIAQGMGKTACPKCIGAVEGETTSDAIYYANTDGTYFHSKSNCSGMKGAAKVSAAEAESRGQMPCPKCVGYYSRQGGEYYHCKKDCSGLKNPDIVTEAVAKSRKQTPCPVCLGGESEAVVYYHTKKGEHYHVDKNCQGMKNATKVSLASAVASGQTPCPVCIGSTGKGAVYYATTTGKYYHTDKNCTDMKGATQITKAAAEAGGKTACPKCIGKATSGGTSVFFTKDGKYYHTKNDCSGMKGAASGTIEQAKKSGKLPCPECINTSGTYVYCTANGTYYHIVSDCSHMKNASYVSIENAKKAGKTACPTCIGAMGGTNKKTTENKGTTSTGEAVEVYCTTDGKYFHSDKTCSGMKNAQGTTVARATKAGKTACPVCLKGKNPTSNAETTSYGDKVEVYCTTNGVHYHTDATCSGMKNAQGTTVERAEKAGKSPCPTCVGKTPVKTDTKTSDGETVEVYCTTNGTYYHANKTCQGMKNAQGTTIAKAAKAGKVACPVCLGSGSARTVYATKPGIYYHSKKNCSGMSGAAEMTIAQAAAKGKCACPVCVGSTDTKVYMTKNGMYYHVKSDCNGMSGASFVTLQVATNVGKTACPTCIGSGSALFTAPVSKPVATPAPTVKPFGTGEDASGFVVYCTANGTYYHTKTNCTGMTGAKLTNLMTATQMGKYPCPTCVAMTAENIVYARPDGKYYHTNRTCSGMTNATTITVAIAKANGKPACPTCAGGTIARTTPAPTSAANKVYITTNGEYYHKTSTCSGIKNAKATTKERAIALYGKTECPVCYGKSSGNTSSDGVFATLTRVYCTTDGKYYHLKQNCSGMKNAKATTADVAKAAGKSACPVCVSTSSATRVYTSVESPYYHKKSVCHGTTYAIATNYTNAVAAGKKGCPYCTVSSSQKVYATLLGAHYHRTNKCTYEDLSGASYITVTKAKDYGKTPCPSCWG